MSEFDYDLFTIGAGSGGVRASRFAANLGAKVAVAEERHLGGTCVNIGCVPKKLMVYASHFAEDFEDAAGYGWTVGEHSFDWKTLIANKDKEIARLNGIYENLLKNAGVELFQDRAVVTGPNEVEVGGKRVTAKHILIATGGRPMRSHEPGQELGLISDDLFYLDEMPKRLLVAGGGYIAVEFAGIFNGLGADVTQMYRGPLFMRGFDADVRAFLADEMKKKGINLVFNTIIERIEKTDEGLKTFWSNGESHVFDAVLYAIGREPNTEGLGLEEAGVEMTDRGAVKIDENYVTSVSSIHAIGDVTDRIQLTPVALAEGMVVARRLFGKGSKDVGYENIPTAVFSQPNIGTVGLTEQAARAKYGRIEVYRAEFKPMKHTMTQNTERGLMKLIVDKASDKVVGAHMVGPEAGEIMQGVGIAVSAGVTKAQFDATIGIHPTAAEEFVTMREPVAEDAAEAAE